MPEENLFDGNTNTDNPPAAAPAGDGAVTPSQDNLFADQLAGIKNSEGKPKYDSVPKALDALDHSQEHILNLTTKSKELESENEQLRLAAAKHESVEDVVSRLTALKHDQVSGTPQPTVVDPAEINKLVRNALDSDRADQSRQNNKNGVTNQIKERFGDKAREVISVKATELGTTPEALGELSADNPQLVLALFAEGGAKPANPTSTSMTLPMGDPAVKELEKPVKSLLAGATSQEQADFMKKIKEDVYAKYDVKT